MIDFKKNAPQIIILLFLVIMATTAVFIGVPFAGLINDALVRLVMNGVLVLSLVPMLNAGVGINYGLPVGISAGLLGMCITVNIGLGGLGGFLGAVLLAMAIGLIFGYGYAKILNRVKGQEEITGIFVGFSFVFIMNFFWAVAPFNNPKMLWPIGGYGMRLTIGLKDYFAKVLNNYLLIKFDQFQIPLGLLIFFAIICILIYLFFKTKIGMAVSVVGENEAFARLSGINIMGARTLAIVFSTILAAVGICVYAQSYGFIELYEAPLMMAFPAASAIFVGGSRGGKTSISQAVTGIFLFQTIYSLSGPLANNLLVPVASEIIRTIVTNGIILFALFFKGGRKIADN